MIAQIDDYRIEEFLDARVITIWEMRNPVIMKNFVEKLFKMHTEAGIGEALKDHRPFDKTKLGIDVAINEWGPASRVRIEKMRAKLSRETPGHEIILDSLDLLEQTHLKPGFLFRMR